MNDCIIYPIVPHEVTECARCASSCECCGRSSDERGLPSVLCDGLCRECIERDFLFDTISCEWMAIDAYGECADCGFEEALFSVGDGLVCLECYRACRRAAAA